MSIAIRLAGPDDAEQVHAFIVALAEYEREPDAVACSAADLREQIASAAPPFECLLAERAGGDAVAVGFALFFHNYSTWRGKRGLYLEDLFVPPSERGRGVGKMLLSELARIAVARDCARMEWSVLAWNRPAIDFYRALGATAMDGWTVYRLTGDALDALARGA